jgi:hypothetical protein
MVRSARAGVARIPIKRSAAGRDRNKAGVFITVREKG